LAFFTTDVILFNVRALPFLKHQEKLMSTTRLFQTNRFLPLFITQFLGAFNDNFFKNALVIIVAYKTVAIAGIRSEKWIALTPGIFILPFFLFSAQAGQLADKFDKAKLTRVVKIAEIGIMAIAGIGLMMHVHVLLFVALFLMGAHSAMFGPIKYGILPQHLTESELLSGNALVEAGTFLAILLGTILGGVLVGTEHGLTWVSGGVMAVAIAGYLASRSIPTAPPPDPHLALAWNPVKPTLQMISFARDPLSVFRSILGISWFWLFGAVLLSVFPVYCKSVLHGNEHVATLLLATFSVGIGVGSMLCGKLSRNHLELGLVPMGSFGMSLFAWHLYRIGIPASFAALHDVSPAQFLQSHEGIAIVGDLFGLSVTSGFFIVPLYAFMQVRSSAMHRSRIVAANNILNALFMVAGSALLVALRAFDVSLPQTFLVLAATNVAVALYIYTLVPEFLIRFLVWCLANIIYRMRVVGEAAIPATGGAIIVANHVSFVDWMLIAAAVHRPVRFVMHHSYYRGPAKWMASQAKIIPIASAKEDPEVLEKAYAHVRKELAEGEVICIFPEGQVTHDGHMAPFRPGILKMLATSPVPVVPVGIRNMWGSAFSRKYGGPLHTWPKRFWSRVEVHIGQPIPNTDVTIARLESEVSRLAHEHPAREAT